MLGEEAKKKTAIVIGNGWEAYGAAHTLAKEGVAVTFLKEPDDAIFLPTVYSGWAGIEGPIKG